MAFGIDYSDARPSHSAMKKAGVKFVCRYIGSTNHTSSRDEKFITPAEYRALKADGFEVVLVFETTAERAEGGREAGIADATVALLEITYCGLAYMPIYFAVDYDTTVGPNITGYFQGIASAIGLKRVGAYGGYKVIKALFDSHLITYGWQTYAWSGRKWDDRAQLRQTLNDQVIGGESVDFDKSMHPDYGQSPVGPLKEKEMAIFAGRLNQGETLAQSIPMGSVKAIGLAYDSNTPAIVRVACHYKAGHGEVFDNIKVGGPTSSTDPWPAKAVKNFAHPEKIDYVSIHFKSGGVQTSLLGWDLGLV